MTRSPRPWPHRATRGVPLRLAGPVVAALLATIIAGCGTAIPVVSFDPASACTTDGRQPGAYPDLEALLPTTYAGRAPDNVDSGRSCTPGALGALAEAGIDAVRFAGATWGLGGSSGLTVAAFEGSGLDAPAMLDFYTQSARADRHTEKLATSDVTVGSEVGHRLDVLATNGAGHTVVTWPADRADTVFVLLAADLGDSAVVAALDEFAAH
jgi:hypothetical protein